MNAYPAMAHSTPAAPRRSASTAASPSCRCRTRSSPPRRCRPWTGCPAGGSPSLSAVGWLEGEFEAAGRRLPRARRDDRGIHPGDHRAVDQGESRVRRQIRRPSRTSPSSPSASRSRTCRSGSAATPIAVLKRIARYATGWWPFLPSPRTFPAGSTSSSRSPTTTASSRTSSTASRPPASARATCSIDDPEGRPGQTKQEIIDRLGWFGELGVTMSSVPIPAVQRASRTITTTRSGWPRRSCRRLLKSRVRDPELLLPRWRLVEQNGLGLQVRQQTFAAALAADARTA